VHVETQEVDQLAGAVDLRLMGRLALAQHGRGVDERAVAAGEQVRRLEKHGRAVLEPPVGPVALRLQRGVYGPRHQLRRRLVEVAEHPGVAVRGGDRHGSAAVRPTVDHDRDVGPLRTDRAQRGLERGAFGAARGICEDWLVAGERDIRRVAHLPKTWDRGEL
jgi:hypothetical protein